MSVHEKMTAIADAVRRKTGGTDLLTLDQIAEGIAAPEKDHRVRFFLNATAGDTISCWIGQSANGVAINWGDGSGTTTYTNTLSSSSDMSTLNGLETTKHTYTSDGEYVVTLDPLNGTSLSLGGTYYMQPFPGASAMEISSACIKHSGKGVYKIMLGACSPVISDTAFAGLSAVELYDFSLYTEVPVLPDKYTFDEISDSCKILVPASLYDEWIAAAHWVDIASHIETV